jgi:two-component system sensor histidine kinase UhpB
VLLDEGCENCCFDIWFTLLKFQPLIAGTPDVYKKVIRMIMKRNALIIACIFLQMLNVGLCMAQDQRKIDSLLNVLTTAKEDTNKVITLIKLSEEAYNYSPDTTRLYAQLALSLSEKLNFTDGRIQSLNALGNAAHYSSDFPLALSYINQSLKIAERTSSKKGMMMANISLGNLYDDMGDINHAKEGYLKAMKLAEEINEKRYLNLATVGLTNAYGSSGDYEKSMLYALKGLKMSEELNDKEYIAVYQYDIGTTYQMQQKYDESLKHLFIALKIQEDIGAKNQVIRNYYRIAESYKNLKRYDEAVKYYNLTMNLSAEMKQKKWIAAANDGIGQILMLQEKYKEATTYFQKEISIAEEINDQEGMSIGYGNIGWAYQKTNNFDAALRYMHQSLAIAKEMGLTVSVIDCYSQIADCYYDKKDYKNAYDYLALYQASNDSLRNKEVINKTAELEARYSNEKREKEIALLTKDKQIQKAEINRQKFIKNSFIGGLALFLILSLFVYNYYRTRQLLKLQTLRNHIASDLHDDVGSTLSSIAIFSELARQQSKEVMPMLDSINESSRKMLESMTDIVWTINPENDNFEKIILRMRSFAYE